MLQSPARHVSRKRLERRNGTFGCGNSAFAYVPRVGDDAGRIAVTTITNIISIHVPRAGDDRRLKRIYKKAGIISTHVPRAGDDVSLPIIMQSQVPFQPTSPVRGTTAKKHKKSQDP